MSEPRHPALPYLAFAALSLIWGASFLFIKLGVQDMSPTVLVLVRSASGTVALGVIMAGMRRSLLSDDWRRRIVPFVIMAVINALYPWAAIAWGEQHISSGLASILNSTTVLWTAILIFWVIPHERPSALNYLGVLIGISGVAILVLPDLATHGLTGSVLGVLAVVSAAISYALAALYQRTKLRGMSVYQQSFGQLAVTSLLAIPIAAPAVPSVHLAWLSMAAVVALGVAGSGIAYLLYYYTMNTLGAVRATGVTFVVPLTAVFWGVVLLKESLTLPVVAGMVVILCGVVLTNVRRASRPLPATRAA
ncbi:MAG TPA: DMT family transporter [Candidatus Dormibacteraeota bacterium]|nr:DMT family transporter [Candidatus Dormibacteraeota bacterium]